MPDRPVAADPADWVCPLPLRATQRVVLGHGGGGVLSEELIDNLFLPAFGTESEPARDSVLLDVESGRIALTTDSYVVQPLFFPGGNIGDLAINGTINDIACSGAQPAGLTAGFIIEEGLQLDVLGTIAATMGRAAAAAGIAIIAGDTKVVERGSAEKLFIDTAGVGVVPAGVTIGPGMPERYMSCVTPLAGLVASVAEIARAASVGVELDEVAIPVPEAVASACSFLGLDPLQVANEGKMVAFVDPDHADAVLAAMRSCPEGARAAVIGRVVSEHPGIALARKRTRRTTPANLLSLGRGPAVGGVRHRAGGRG